MEEKAILTAPLNQVFLQELEKQSGEKLSRCYQCGRCATVCPLSSLMEFTPRELFLLAMLGEKDEVLSCNTPWVCASCYACAVVCPNDINITHLMDSLRQKAAREKYPVKYPAILTFHRIFLSQIKYLGRTNELLLMGIYRLAISDLFKDLPLGVEMVKKGRLKPVIPFPKGSRGLGRLIREEKSEA